MATTPNPTNEQIVKVLDQILRELGNVKSGQQALAAGLSKLAQALEK
jgi:hypothetical protein